MVRESVDSWDMINTGGCGCYKEEYSSNKTVLRVRRGDTRRHGMWAVTRVLLAGSGYSISRKS